jgi:hypothetical protein
MNLALANAGIVLKPEQFLRIQESQNSRILCETGSVWITQDGDPRDVVLGAGEQFMVDRPGQVVVFSLSGATLELRSCIHALADVKSGWRDRLTLLLNRALGTSRVFSSMAGQARAPLHQL